MILIEIVIGYVLYIRTSNSIYFFQGPMPLDSRDQCASFEPLVDHFGKGPSTAGQPGLSGLVVGGPKTYNTMVKNNP